MSSQKSSHEPTPVGAASEAKPTPVGVAPKRERGRQRVAAILDAARKLFAEQGFDAVTMTAVAENSGTAIGSLYRFFPTKEALADAVLARWTERFVAELDELSEAATVLGVEKFADHFIDKALAFAPERAAALVLLDAGRVDAARRAELAAQFRGKFAAVLARLAPGTAAEPLAAKARLMQLLFKMAAGFGAEDEATRAQLRALAHLFFEIQVGGG